MSDSKQPVNRKYGDYRCIALLDSASDSALYHALHVKTGKIHTLRTISLRRDKENRLEQTRDSILSEVESVKNITNPAIIPIVDYGIDGQVVYMVMPLMRGNSLHNRLQSRNITAQNTEGLPSLGQISELVARIADALQTIHDAKYVHGQVEPRAILFDEAGLPYLADVGLIRLHKIIFHLDNTNSFSVTRYSAPELWEGDKPVPPSDQYALACIAYELITGRAPFESETLFGLMKSHVNDAVMPPNYIRRDLQLPTELAMVFWQALAKPIDRRYTHIREFANAFARVTRGSEGVSSDFFTFPLP